MSPLPPDGNSPIAQAQAELRTRIQKHIDDGLAKLSDTPYGPALSQ